MLRKFLIILRTLGENTPIEDKVPIIFLFCLVQIIILGFYASFAWIPELYRELVGALVSFIWGLSVQTTSLMLVREREVVFLSRVIKNFNKKIYLALPQLILMLLFNLESLISLLLFSQSLLFLLPLILGEISALFIGFATLSWRKSSKRIYHFSSQKFLLLQKELLLFLNTSYTYFFIIVYCLVFFTLVYIRLPHLVFNSILLLIISVMFNDTFTLNSLGIEFHVLYGLKREGIVDKKAILSKYKIWFFIGLFFYSFLIFGFFFTARENVILTILNLFGTYLLNFCFTAFLSVRGATSSTGYYHVKMSNVVLELVGVVLFIPLFILGIQSFWLFIMIGIAVGIFQKKIKDTVMRKFTKWD